MSYTLRSHAAWLLEYNFYSQRLSTLFLISTGLLNQKCSNDHLIHISKLIAQWRDIAPSLGLTPADEQDIIGDAPQSIQRQRIGMLYKWSVKEGDNATYQKLAEIFKQCERQDIVDEIKRLVTGGTGESILPLIFWNTVGIHRRKLIAIHALKLL